MTSAIAHTCLVDHIRQVAAHIIKLVLGVHLGPHFGVVGGQRCYHLKKWFVQYFTSKRHF